MKCFQKAFELDATEADAARLLAEGYADDDEWARVRTIAMRVMEGEGGVEGVAGGEVMNAKGRFAPKNGWAWKALGSTEMASSELCRRSGGTDDWSLALQKLCQSGTSVSNCLESRSRRCVNLGASW